MTYIPNPHHRNATFSYVKSQWSVTVLDEIACYNHAVNSNWKCAIKNNYWGILLQNNLPTNIGVSPLPDSSPLFIAKFVADAQDNWHGYPVATWLSPFDKPIISILNNWQQMGFINSSQKAKLYRGKLCAL